MADQTCPEPPRTLPDSEERYRRIFESADEAVYAHDLEGQLTWVNTAWERLTGYTREEAAAMNVFGVFAPDGEQPEAPILKAMRAEFPFHSELIIVSKGGARVPVDVCIRPIYAGDARVGVQGTARDLSERKELEQQLVYLANHDTLTGLLNRRRFEEELQLQLAQARRSAAPGALLFLDLDHFKDVNDTLGHRAGDELVVAVGRVLREWLPQPSMLARLGGDEFTAVLPGTEMNEAQREAEGLLDRLRAHGFEVGGETLTVSASIGLTEIPPEGVSTAEELLSRADVAMYEAKENGRNRVWQYSAERDWQAEIESRLSWRRRIVQALDRGLLTLHAQPILDLKTDRISQYELLLRLSGDSGKSVNAATFIDHAERFGLVQAIDRWVVAKAIQLLSEYGGERADLVLEVNVSAHAFADPELLPLIRQQLATTSCDPRRLVLEVTESLAVANLHEAHRFLAELRSVGCKFALDDFGVGFSSLHHLKHLDVDYLKIDGGFVRNLAHDTADQHLVKAIVDVARALGKKTVAEYVTDSRILELLRSFGVDYAQGYYIGEPRDASRVLSDLRDETAA